MKQRKITAFAALALTALWLAPQNAGTQTISGGKVYTAGYYMNADTSIVACYWEGTERHDLPGAQEHATDLH